MSDFKTVIDKLDKLDSRIDNIDITLVRQEAQLAEHIRRTNILEQKLEPVERHVDRVNTVIKIFTYAGAILSFFAGLYATFR